METFSIDKMKSAYSLLEGKDYDNGYREFIKAVKDVPSFYYSNIFFPGNAGKEKVIVTDIRISDDVLLYTIRPIGVPEEKRTVRFDEFPAFSVEVVRNIIAAVEVSQIARSEALRREEDIKQKEQIIENAEIRKTI